MQNYQTSLKVLNNLSCVSPVQKGVKMRSSMTQRLLCIFLCLIFITTSFCEDSNQVLTQSTTTTTTSNTTTDQQQDQQQQSQSPASKCFDGRCISCASNNTCQHCYFGKIQDGRCTTVQGDVADCSEYNTKGCLACRDGTVASKSSLLVTQSQNSISKCTPMSTELSNKNCTVGVQENQQEPTCLHCNFYQIWDDSNKKCIFISRSFAINHCRQHIKTGENQYKCNLCDIGFMLDLNSPSSKENACSLKAELKKIGCRAVRDEKCMECARNEGFYTLKYSEEFGNLCVFKRGLIMIGMGVTLSIWGLIQVVDLVI